MKFNKDMLGKNWIPYTVATCSAVVVYLLLSHIGNIWHGITVVFGFISPVFGGIILAYLIDALVVFFEKKVFKKISSDKRRRLVSLVVAMLLLLAFLVTLALTLIPQLFESVRVLVNNLGGYVRSLQDTFDQPVLTFGKFSLDISTLIQYGEGMLERLALTLRENIGRVLDASVNIGKGFFNGVICVILAIYFLMSKEQLLEVIKKALWQHMDEQKYRRLSLVGRQCNRILISYIACDLFDGLIVGVANFIFMTVFGMPYGVLVSVFVGLTNLLPTFGPIIGGAIGAFILLLANPGHMVWFLVFTVILQTIDGYIIKPHLFGDSLGVPPLWVLVSVIVGGRIFGVWGIMLAIPFAAITDFVFRDILWTKLTVQQATNQVDQLAAEQLKQNAINQLK
ncbi:MAG: AI-2E family transporter [Oscillospiraceae bacterium]|nr:AI-2E family transporter [Oscillospiraceae bacterium]